MFALPNALTILRITLVPVFAIAFVMPGDGARLVAFLVFTIAGLSDALDGLAARKLNAGSEFGRMLDPIADKVLVAVALMMLVAEGNISQFNLTVGLHSLLRLVPALIILSREILVSGLREFLAETRVKVRVTAIAKFKTAIQMVAIGAMILTRLGDEYLPYVLSLTYSTVAYSLLWIAAGLTVYTGYVYFRSGIAYLKPGPEPMPPAREFGVTLLYFAWVRQKIGRSEENIDAPAATVRALIDHLRSLGAPYADAFADESRIRVAINQKHSGFDAAIAPGDEIAFFPPVTGG